MIVRRRGVEGVVVMGSRGGGVVMDSREVERCRHGLGRE